MADEYECDMCGATFDSEEELQQHNQEEHADEM
jgi:rubredoxin